MNRAAQLLQLLQLNGGTFPTGGFSQSWGLETYVADGTVHDTESFKGFLEAYLMSSIGKCEGPILCSAYELTGRLLDEQGKSNNGDAEAAVQLRELEMVSNAIKVTKESREAGLRMGRAFERIVRPMLGEAAFLPLHEVFEGKGVSYPVIYGCVCRLMEIDRRESLAAYAFSTANTLTQSALKLIPLGNVEAQKALFEMQDVLEAVCDTAEATEFGDITNFCPGIDIASLRHEELPVRLYMS